MEMDYKAIIKEVGRGAEGATDLTQEVSLELFEAMLNGHVPDLELGALLIAFRIKGESEAELLGFYHAMQQHLCLLRPPAEKILPVVIPSYNGARRNANLTPLLALLLARLGLKVLVHGVTQDPTRVTSAEVFTELNVPHAANRSQAQAALDKDGMAFIPVATLSPALERLLALRWRLGLRSSAHTLAKLADPFAGNCLRLIGVSHPEYLDRMANFFRDTHSHALLLRGTEGEVYANPRRRPQMEHFRSGERAVLLEAEQGTVTALPELPAASDAVTTARWTRQALAGEIPVPTPILEQVACCLYASGKCSSLDEALSQVGMTARQG
jgi:anthranilate phosphoribosyltransferase